MPELPEIETLRRQIAPRIQGCVVERIVVRNPDLRWPVPSRRLGRELAGSTIDRVDRRAKYLLFRTQVGTLIVHLGMSGRLCLVSGEVAPERHDHVDFLFKGGPCLRYHDPRRFGAILWTRADPAEHRLLAKLGPEPLEDGLDGDHLHRLARGRRRKLHDYLLDGRVVAGVGNIYASEAAFRAGLRPGRSVARISRPRYERLAESIKQVLSDAIDCGGTTLRDYRQSDGRPGGFQPRLRVYGREGEPCVVCGEAIQRAVRQGRSTYFCRKCQS